MGLAVQISIHAPAKGATIQAVKKMVQIEFQSTLPRRERLRTLHNGSRMLIFQSTLPRRERLGFDYYEPESEVISIHAPAKGATGKALDDLLDLIFQSTLPRRERQAQKRSFIISEKFQSTLPRRERQTTLSLSTLPLYFNPRSREGSDLHQQISRYRLMYYFNPRSREGSDDDRAW